MRAAILLSLALLTSTVQAQDVPQHRRVVVELFTSQGCSSCPPAEAILRELATQPDILALSFHVTYWNSLGWTDPYSLNLATERQRQYQRIFDTNTIYTPQLVVQGAAEMVGSERQTVARAIMRAAALAAQSTGPVIRAAPATGGLAVEVGAGIGAAKLLLIGFDRQHQTKIARGENAGRELVEANIVRSLQKIADWNGEKLSILTPVPLGEQTAILLQAPDGRILATTILQATTAGQEQG
jgi:hypothetical protein